MGKGCDLIRQAIIRGETQRIAKERKAREAAKERAKQAAAAQKAKERLIRTRLLEGIPAAIEDAVVCGADVISVRDDDFPAGWESFVEKLFPELVCEDSRYIPERPDPDTGLGDGYRLYTYRFRPTKKGPRHG